MRPLSFVRKKIFCFESLLKVFCWQEKRRRSRRRRLSAGKRASSLSRSSNPPLSQCANPFSAATKNSSTDHPLFLSPTKFCEMGMQLCICVFGRFLSLCISIFVFVYFLMVCSAPIWNGSGLARSSNSRGICASSRRSNDLELLLPFNFHWKLPSSL